MGLCVADVVNESCLCSVNVIVRKSSPQPSHAEFHFSVFMALCAV